MVPGAAAGMAATFNAPLASVLLAVELLLFEWRPRSFLPVTCAVAVATVVRAPLLGADPLFPVGLGGAHATPVVDLLCVGAGLVGGLLAVAVTALVYFSEDQFARLPVHWMWWPAIGGLIIGVGGLIEPRALRSPLTGVVFSLELTHAWSALVPLLVASASAYGLSALLLRRSVLTEKIARRGYHLSREYDVDPLEVLLADEVMAATPAVLPPDAPLPPPRDLLAATLTRRSADGSARADAPLQRLYPVVDDRGRLQGAVPRQSLVAPGEARTVTDVLIADPVVVHADDTLREIASRFARHGITAAPVVDRADPARLVGLVTVDHLLDGRLRDLAEEHDRERPLGPRSWRPRSGRRRDGYATLRT